MPLRCGCTELVLCAFFSQVLGKRSMPMSPSKPAEAKQRMLRRHESE